MLRSFQCFVEAMDLIDEEDRVPAAGALHLGSGDGLADVLDAREHRRQGDEFRVEGLSHQSREGGLADTRRAPQDHGVGLAGLKGQGQRLAGPEQVGLPDHVGDRPRTHGLRQRHPRRIEGVEQVGHRGEA